jgi:hypothetical protein
LRRLNDIDTGALECGMNPVQVFHREADIRTRFLTSVGRIDVEEKEICRPFGPRPPSGVHVTGSAVLVDLRLAKRQSKEVPVEGTIPSLPSGAPTMNQKDMNKRATAPKRLPTAPTVRAGDPACRTSASTPRSGMALTNSANCRPTIPIAIGARPI